MTFISRSKGRARSVFVAVAVIAGLAASATFANRAVAHTGHTFSISDATVTEGTGTGAATGDQQYDTATKNVSLTITVTPAPQVGETLQVSWATSTASPSTATADDTAPLNYPGDFLTSSNTVTFDAPNETSASATIQIQSDRADEPNETFLVNLGNPVATCHADLGCNGVNSTSAEIADGQGVVTITDDDATPTLEVLNISHLEGNADSVAQMQVQRRGASNRDVSFSYSTANNTATAGSDYSATSGTATVPNSNAEFTSANVPVTILTDDVPEGNENFFLNISSSTNATITDSQGVITILDGDAAAVFVENNPRVGEGGNLVFKVRLSQAPSAGKNAKVNFATQDGTATGFPAGTPGGDYTSQSGTLTFPQFEDGPFDVVVRTRQDNLVEVDETMKLVLSKPADPGTFDYSIYDSPASRDGEGTGTISDNDVPDVVHDFNADGFADAVFGAPREDIGSARNAGGVNVIYGTANGLSTAAGAAPDQALNLNSKNVEGVAAANDLFGSSLTHGDFDNDGYDDLAVGIPGKSGSGAVSVFYGSEKGLSAANDQLWTQNSTDVEDSSEAGDRFGTSVAAGDFNDDGFSDLAVGAPGEAIGAITGAGAVNVLYGSANGLAVANDQFWHQDSTDIGETAEAGDAFGGSLAAGDFDDDGRDDLLVGVSAEDLGPLTDAGLAHAIYGGASGLAAAESQLWDQGQTDIEETPESGDRFAFSVAAGDVNGDGFADGIFGVPKEDVGTLADAGGVNIILGSTGGGLTAAGDQYIDQNSGEVEGSAETGDQFGFSVAVADFGKDTKGDLAVGVPGEDVGSIVDAGSVAVFYGTTTGVGITTDDQLWHQNSTGIAGASERGDLMGASVGTGDFDADGDADLLAGAPSEDLNADKKNAGAANVLYGAANGLAAAGNRVWHQDVAGVAGGAEAGDAFGQAVT